MMKRTEYQNSSFLQIRFDRMELSEMNYHFSMF